MMDEDTKALLDHVVSNPPVYAKAISEAMKLHPDDPVDNDRYRRIGTALGLAKMIGQDRFAQSIRGLIEDATERLRRFRAKIKPRSPIADDALRDEYQHLLLLRSSALDIVSEWSDPGAVQLCIDGLITEREYMSGADIVMLRYLEKVAPALLDIRSKLEGMYHSLDSPLRNNPQLLRVLEAIDRAEADKADSRNERKAPRKP